MEKGEPLAELEAGGGAICQGKASAEPIPQFCCGNLPKQALACAPRQGGAWLDCGRKQSSTTVTLKEREAQKAFPSLGLLIYPSAGTLGLPLLHATNLMQLSQNPRSNKVPGTET